MVETVEIGQRFFEASPSWFPSVRNPSRGERETDEFNLEIDSYLVRLRQLSQVGDKQLAADMSAAVLDKFEHLVSRGINLIGQ